MRMLLTLFGVMTFTFFLGRLTGDPVLLMLPQTASQEDIERVRAELGLNQPLPLQYVLYLAQMAQGDFGESINYGRPALDVVMERVPATLELGLPALILSVLIGIPLGVIAAQHRDKPFDRFVMSVSMAGQSLPAFFVGILLVLFFGVRLGWLPTFGRDTASSLILPTMTLLISPLAVIIRLTRSSMLEVLNETYIRTAQAKGLSQWRVIYLHALKNSLIPVITIVGLQVATILSGSAIIETVFAWPGIGALAVQSIGTRDFPIIQTVVLITAASFAIVNTAVDFVYVMVDPRIRA